MKNNELLAFQKFNGYLNKNGILKSRLPGHFSRNPVDVGVFVKFVVALGEIYKNKIQKLTKPTAKPNQKTSKTNMSDHSTKPQKF